MNIDKTMLRNKLKVINNRIDIAERDIMDEMRKGVAPYGIIEFREIKRQEAKAISNILYK